MVCKYYHSPIDSANIPSYTMFRTKEKDLQRNESSSQRSNPDVLTNNYNGFKWRNDLCYYQACLEKTFLMK